MSYQNIKGMPDLLPDEVSRWQVLERILHHMARVYGFSEIRTPIMEATQLFTRSIGEATDVVEKEMYSFDDRSGDSVTLRPEGTASVVRAFLQHHLAHEKPVHKLYYIGPMFRHERPQKGRYRQFNQLGVEVIGARHPLVDVEVIHLLYAICERLEIKGLTMHINSVGDAVSRPTYRLALQTFLKQHIDQLDDVSKGRVDTNPLRVFDSKSADTQALLKRAPKMIDYLSTQGLEYLNTVSQQLQNIGVPVQVNPSIVRGLDYYTDTVFELVADGLGAQNVVGGGGRYDDLIQACGGPPTPAVGFAMGLERLLLAAPELAAQPTKQVTFLPLEPQAESLALTWASALRQHSQHGTNAISVDIVYGKSSLKSGLRQLNKNKVEWAVIIGAQELALGQAQLKNLQTHQQSNIALNEVVTTLLRELSQ